MKKRIFALLLAGVTAVSLTGCDLSNIRFTARSETAAQSGADQSEETEAQAGETGTSSEETAADPAETDGNAGENAAQESAASDDVPEARMTVPFETDSVSYCLLDSDGAVLVEKNAYLPLKPASITKVLTALVVLEHADLSDSVTVSQEAVQDIDVLSSGTDPVFKPGEVFSVNDLLQALLLCSSNAAGNILAEYCAGSTEAFADLMNEKCASLGLTHSHFSNAHGLDSDDHYTCAYDMAVITKTAGETPAVLDIMKNVTYTMPATAYNAERVVKNGYRFINGIDSLEGAVAGKPGWTVGAQGTLVSIVERNGVRVYAAVMDSDEDRHYLDTANLVNYVYDQNTALRGAASNIFISDEAQGSLHMNWSTIGDAASCRLVYWKTQDGTANAVSIDLTPSRYMEYVLPLESAGTYTIQLFVTDTSGRETGNQMNVLYTGSLKGSDMMMTWNGNTYYQNSHGFIKTGYVEFPHYVIYTNEYGWMLTSSFTPDGMYYAGEDGKLITGWKTVDGSTYYFQADGTKVIGDYLLDGTLYHFDENGVKQ